MTSSQALAISCLLEEKAQTHSLHEPFSHQQQQQSNKTTLQSHLDYWMSQLAGELPILELPTDKLRSTNSTVQSATYTLLLPQSLTAELKSLSQREGVTLFMTLLAAFKILLHRYTGQTDIVVGNPIVVRDRLETESLKGVFNNMLALRTSLADNPTFQNLLSQVRQVTLGAYTHQSLPFEKLVEALQIDRDLGQNSIFQTLFQLNKSSYEATFLEENHKEFNIKERGIEKEISAFDLSLDIAEKPQGLVCNFQYRTELFNPSTIQRMAGHFQSLLDGIIKTPEQTISQLPLLTEGERHQLLVEWNNTQTDYPRDKCIHQVFEEQVTRTPDAIAVVFEDQQLTYQALNVKANQLAYYLQSIGVGPDVLVGLCVEPSLEMMVGMLAILKAGGAYVPLDPDYPAERLTYILADTSVPVLLTQQALLPRLPSHSALVIPLDTAPFLPSKDSQQNVSTTVASTNLAYTIYTSGSTGKPKGVLLEHQGLCNLAEAKRSLFKLAEQTRCLQSFSLSFDGSVATIFSTLISGATLYLIRKGQLLAGERFVNWLHHHKINVVTLPPALLSVLPLHPLPHLAIIATAGEACPPMLAEQWGGNRQFFNAYGPTEATVCATIAQITDSSAPLPIGHPIANTQTYILDTHLQPVPVGIPGELLIGGEGLARGYRNRPELTAAKFIPHPFTKDPQARLYKSGDLARYLPDGQIEYLGRIDHQVKLRGFRIELGEIEAVLSQHAQVNNAVVIVREDKPGHKQLTAYLVSQVKALSPQKLRQFVKQQLPDYMVPSAFVLLEELPLTPNGKVDRRALPLPQYGEGQLPTDSVKPQSTLELKLIKLCERILNCQPMGVLDNFFDRGGNSLLAVQFCTAVEQTLPYTLTTSALFQAPTMRELAAVLENDQANVPSSLIPVHSAGSRKPLFFVNSTSQARALSPCMDVEQPIYSLNIFGVRPLLGDRIEHFTLSELAGYLLKDLQTIQPDGPYQLVGYCQDGALTLELAQQLRQQGKEVSLVCLIDSLFQSYQGTLWHRLQSMYEFGLDYYWERLLRKLLGKDINWDAPKAFETLTTAERLQLLEKSQKDQAFYHQYFERAMAYQPHPYDQKVVALLSSELRFANQHKLRRTIAAQDFEVHVVRGLHSALFRTPYVQNLAKKLEQNLQFVQAADREERGLSPQIQ